jgi:NAD(P)H-dependent FMN reductase
MTAAPRIAVVIGSTRDSRFGEKPARWVHEIAAARDDMEVELVDLRDFDLPFFNEVASNAWVPTQSPEGVRWQRKVAEFDGFVFVTPEYNRSVPASLKNALDFAYPEWNRKAAAVVGYGPLGAARAAEHLRTIAVELQLAPTRTGVHLQGADFMAAHQNKKSLDAMEYLKSNAERMLDELAWWAGALKSAREATAAAAAA